MHFETLGDEAAFQNWSQNTSFGNHRQSGICRLLFKRAEAACSAQQELVDSPGSRKESTLPQKFSPTAEVHGEASSNGPLTPNLHRALPAPGLPDNLCLALPSISRSSPREWAAPRGCRELAEMLQRQEGERQGPAFPMKIAPTSVLSHKCIHPHRHTHQMRL